VPGAVGRVLTAVHSIARGVVLMAASPKDDGLIQESVVLVANYAEQILRFFVL
jgi:hypothetical protein